MCILYLASDCLPPGQPVASCRPHTDPLLIYTGSRESFASDPPLPPPLAPLKTPGREFILKIHSRKMNLMRGIDLKSVAEKLINANGAECKAVCTEAGMFALRERRIHVTQEDFEMAVAKVMKKESDMNMSIKKLFK